MVGIVTSPVVPEYDAPEETAAKLSRLWNARTNWEAARQHGVETRGKPKPELVDARGQAARQIVTTQTLAALNDTNAYAPSWHKATFRVPLGIRMSQYEKRRDEAASIWVSEMTKQGYDLCTDSRVVVKPGPYPAIDLYSGMPLLGERECILLARFVWRTPELFTWEIPPDWFGQQG